MNKKETKDFLIRGMPIEVFGLLEKTAKEHHRSMTQEAILALKTGLSHYSRKIEKPTPFKWWKKPTTKFITEAIDEGRE